MINNIKTRGITTIIPEEGSESGNKHIALKGSRFNLDINNNRRGIRYTETSFFTMDKGTSWKGFAITDNGKPLDLTDSKVIVGFQTRGFDKIIDCDGDSIRYPNRAAGLVDIDIPVHIKEMIGDVLIHIYIDYGNGMSGDVSVLHTRVEQSLIHKNLPEMQEFYVESFEKLRADILLKAEEIKNILHDIAQGPQGPQGERGNDGRDGIDGLPGPQGLQGEIGPTGPEGPVGPQGERGENVISGINALGRWSREIIYSINDLVTGLTGNAYISISDDNLGNDPTEDDSMYWIKFVAAGAQGIQGEQGPQGPIGVQGAQGPQGERGGIGPTGPQGEQGLPGTGSKELLASGTWNNHSNTPFVLTIPCTVGSTEFYTIMIRVKEGTTAPMGSNASVSNTINLRCVYSSSSDVPHLTWNRGIQLFNQLPTAQHNVLNLLCQFALTTNIEDGWTDHGDLRASAERSTRPVTITRFIVNPGGVFASQQSSSNSDGGIVTGNLFPVTMQNHSLTTTRTAYTTENMRDQEYLHILVSRSASAMPLNNVTYDCQLWRMG